MTQGGTEIRTGTVTGIGTRNMLGLDTDWMLEVDLRTRRGLEKGGSDFYRRLEGETGGGLTTGHSRLTMAIY